MSQVTTEQIPQAPPEPVEDPEAPFGPNEMRLGPKQWLAFAIVMLAIFIFLPRVWGALERFETGPDYRVPYELSNDYWLIGRWLDRASTNDHIVLVGDSVIWGEYVNNNGTLTHFLNSEAKSDRFVNGGVNGFFPLALEGLVDHYGHALSGKKVILECDVLWMTSPRSDLSSSKKDAFNHSRLVPQFRPKIPCYQADTNERISAIIERNVSFLSWVSHIQIDYFGQKSLPQWTLADDGNSPPSYPNLWKYPASQVTMQVPSSATPDPDRGPSSPRHVSWFKSGKEPLHYEWVALDKSLQWQAFQRTAELLRVRGSDVFVVLVPFNEHMVAVDNRAKFHTIRTGIDSWLTANKFPHVISSTLPSELYADASHPLTEGYAMLAKTIYSQPTFQNWLNAGK